VAYRLLLVVGARPNFMKIAPIVAELKRWSPTFEWRLIHTGQHYDASMSDVFFRQLGIPRPDIDLGVGSGSHAQQTASIMVAFEPVLRDWRPDMVIVVGDVNSTIACALVASKLGIRVAHVEAGLRSFDRTMPEEVNRVLTDQLSDLLFTTEETAITNLTCEGRAATQIYFVGNVMIDTLLAHRNDAMRLRMSRRHGLEPGGFAVLTLHRPSNVDDDTVFDRLITGIARIAREMPIVFPVHPRTRSVLARSTQAAALIRERRLLPVDPLGYLEFLGLMAESRLALTDSGGVQEETTVLGIPCLTLRDTTERPATITHGTNRLVGTNSDRICAGWADVKRDLRPHRLPPLWDGNAAKRLVAVLRAEAAADRAARSATSGELPVTSHSGEHA
jgi:UDP-N-acetylglucosamine 2-epimerase (non-hydrolysing)